MMKHYYDMQGIINDGNFKNWSEVVFYILKEFHKEKTLAERLNIIEFAQQYDIDLLSILTGEHSIEMYSRPIKEEEENKSNIEEE